MDATAIVNCETGQIVHRDMNPDEDAQRQKDLVEHAKQQQERQQEEAAAEGVIAAVAQQLKMPVDDLKAAFRVGKRTPKADPNKKPKART